MGKNTGKLSHEEIWDDSALVKSWDEAVEEYRHYHSIHARGENVEEILKKAEEEGIERAVQSVTGGDQQQGGHPMMVEDTGEQRDEETNEAEQGAQTATHETAPTGDQVADEPGEQPDTSAQAQAAGATVANVPEAMLGHVQDPALKNLMMAWYFAGYYTGLYEGQRLREQQQQQQR
ncbi:hypothetical protein VTN31DRAFT_826 [Thermomyces dupontii]|uniref:uncharacterized protein n=1 Tax=Talaromyces thermophilus TaxID=28565 RepID=UPI00374443AC